MLALLPWQIHPALTEDRLTAVANIVWRVRVEVALRMEPDKGDSLWGTGCSAYERTCRAIAEAAAQDLKAWLSVEQADHHFLLKLGGVPVRIYRGDSEEPTPSRYAVPHNAEVAALQFAFQLAETPTPDKVFRIEVTTDAKSYPLAITLVQVDVSGEKFNPFRIPVSNAAVRPIVRKKPAVMLNPPEVGSKESVSDNRIEGAQPSAS